MERILKSDELTTGKTVEQLNQERKYCTNPQCTDQPGIFDLTKVLSNLSKLLENKQYSAFLKDAVPYLETEVSNGRINKYMVGLCYNIGSVYELMDDKKSAKKYYEKAIKLDISHYNSHFNLIALLTNELSSTVEKINATKDENEIKKLKSKAVVLCNEVLPYFERINQLNDKNELGTYHNWVKEVFAEYEK